MNLKEITDEKFYLEVKKIPLDELNGWIFDEKYMLKHKSNGFFTFLATEQNNKKNILLFQNEIGLLAIFLRYKNKDFDNQKLLLQKKQEPGNLPLTQISPSIQMTFSNLNGLHGGSKSNLDFINNQKKNLLYGFIKHEQSDSFLLKRNLNVLCHYKSDIEKTKLLNTENNVWISTIDLIDYILFGNIVHSDTRSVLFLYLGLRIIEIFKYKLLKGVKKDLINNINLWNFKNQKNWRFTNMKDITFYKNGSLYLKDVNKTSDFRSISGFRIKSNNREVSEWDQPLLEISKKVYSLIYTFKNNEINIFVSLKTSNGTWNEVEFLPTFCCDIKDKKSTLINDKDLVMMHESDQSDEGGRFWRRSNTYKIYFAENYVNYKNHDDKILISLSELIYFYKNSNHISMELRSICVILFSFLIKSSWKSQ